MAGNSKIVFLGTAGDSLVMGKQMRACGGIYVETDDVKLLINPGPGAVVRARQYNVNLREIDVILVSENSLLMANDVNAIIDAMTNGGLDTKGVVVCSSNVVNGTTQSHPAISPFHKTCVEKLIPLKIGDKVAINSTEIKPSEVKAKFDDSMGFKILTHAFSLSYVGNTGYQKHIAEQHKGSDILILNVPFVTKKSETNLNIEQACKIVDIVQPQLVIITHFGIKMLESDLLTHVRTIQRTSGIQTVAAKEGMIVDPKSYSATQRQKRLVI